MGGHLGKKYKAKYSTLYPENEQTNKGAGRKKKRKEKNKPGTKTKNKIINLEVHEQVWPEDSSSNDPGTGETLDPEWSYSAYAESHTQGVLRSRRKEIASVCSLAPPLTLD